MDVLGFIVSEHSHIYACLFSRKYGDHTVASHTNIKFHSSKRRHCVTFAQLIARLPRYSHISSYSKGHLHWLPISTRIDYKVMLKAQMGVAPKYLRDTIRLPTSASSLRSLRSLDRRELFLPRTGTTMAMHF